MMARVLLASCVAVFVVTPTPTAMAATTTEVVQGQVLRIESTRDLAAMGSMEPGAAVTWQFTISASRADGVVSASLETSVDDAVFDARIVTCDASWNGTACTGRLQTLHDGPLVDGTLTLLEQSAAFEQRYRVEVVLREEMPAARAQLVVRATGLGETVESDGASTLPTTGASLSPSQAFAAAAGAVVAIAVGVARSGRRCSERAS